MLAKLEQWDFGMWLTLPRAGSEQERHLNTESKALCTLILSWLWEWEENMTAGLKQEIQTKRGANNSQGTKENLPHRWMMWMKLLTRPPEREGGGGLGGGNQCLPLLNGDVNHLFQLEGFTGSEILCRNKLFSTWTHIYYTNYTITHIPLLEWANTHAF